jgi:hypothetical protein
MTHRMFVGIFTKLIPGCLLSLLITMGAFGQPKSIEAIDTPTAFTIERGGYLVSLLGYDNGGVELKTIIGLHDSLYLGISFDVQNAIGKERAQPNIPGVIARIKLTDGWPFFPAIALGYDSFYIGQQGKRENPSNRFNRMIYGPYVAFTSPIYLFNAEQYVSYGIRLPVQPDYLPNDTAYFLALDFPLGELFRFKSELERVYWNFRNADEWLINVGIRYTYLYQLGIEADLLIQPGERINRILRIEYHDEF